MIVEDLSLETVSDTQEPDPVGDLIEQLIVKILKGEGVFRAHAGAADGPQVLLEMEVDGERYSLVREHPRRWRTQEVLSPREQEIARMVAKGYANKTIASVLDISSWTVSTHLRRCFAKLGVGSRAALVGRLLQEGLVPPNSSSES